MLDYSVVIPVYNEDESLDTLFSEIKTQLATLLGTYEIIFVNDCSDDRSSDKMQAFAQQLPDKVRIVNLTQRSGQTVALNKGLEVAGGDIVITLDADLQNDPADIPKLIARMQQGYDVVCGWRKDRHDPSLKKVLSKLGNILQRAITGMRIHDVSCTLRAYKKGCLNDLKLTWEGQHRFIPLMLSKKGYRVGEIVTNHRDRQFGYSKYAHKRIFKVIADFFKILFMR